MVTELDHRRGSDEHVIEEHLTATMIVRVDDPGTIIICLAS